MPIISANAMKRKENGLLLRLGASVRIWIYTFLEYHIYLLERQIIFERFANVKKKAYRVAIAGATGVAGREFLKILEERDFPVTGSCRSLQSGAPGQRSSSGARNSRSSPYQKRVLTALT